MDEFFVPDCFEKVWERVTERNARTDVPMDKCRELENFIDRKMRAIAFYKVLIGRCGKREGQTLCRILADERRHLRQLQLQYFMLTGDSMPLAQPKQSPMGLLSACREASLAEAEACRMFRRGAEDWAHTRELFLAIAEDEERHSQLMAEAVARLFKGRG